jgi:hypothetical protein
MFVREKHKITPPAIRLPPTGTDRAGIGGRSGGSSSRAVARYVASLHAVLEPEGVLHLMCFSDEEPGSWGPRRVTRDELRSAFAVGWRIESIEPADFELNGPSGSARAWLVRCRRASP